MRRSVPPARGVGITLFCCLLLGSALLSAGAPQGAISFDRDVQPILSDNCFACHGPDPNTRQMGLRLDTREGATQKLLTGKWAIVPHDPAASELIQRVTSDTPGLRMPPTALGKQLSPQQIATLRAWIEQGAPYGKHWAFVPPKRPALPAVQRKDWPRNPIDRFILARLEKEGLHPSPEADRPTLIRRLSLDLTGLPPTPAEVDAFVKDARPDAYDRLVDRLLASPHYGERLGLLWLDLARYADTHGFHIDSQRDMWLWRDWVISAFNRNLPYDKFLTWQLAGDLLPNPTQEQRIATGFNRNHPINFEGGAIPEEYAAAYIFDRINTTATTFMGLTLKCAQCHDHKFDPLTQKEFYEFYAFFNNVPEQGLDGQKGNAAPFLKVPTPEQQRQLAEYDGRIGEAEAAVKARTGQAATGLAEWEKSVLASLGRPPAVSAGLAAHYALDENQGAQVANAAVGGSPAALQGKADWAKGKLGGALRLDGKTYVDLGTALDLDRNSRFSYGAWVNPAGKEPMTVLSRMDDGAGYRGWDLYLSEGKVFVHLIHEWEKDALRVVSRDPIETEKWTHLFVTYDGSGKARGLRLYINGRPAQVDITHDSLTGTLKTAKPVLIGRRNPAAPFRGLIDDVRIYDRELSPAEVDELAGYEAVRPILALPPEKRTQEQRQALSRHYLEGHDEEYRKLTADLADWRKKRADLDGAIPTTMVMEEMPQPRETHILLRGQYDQPGEVVKPGTPAVLPPLRVKGRANRLDLARWLVDPGHPLTARVAVNHYWQLLFGTGLVKTSEDFGTQGERPSHPELLDWLATEFVRTGWDIKGMLRLMVTSATYRQTSRVTPELREKDPENRLLARAPRLRLPAELIRDQALAVSGLLVDRIGGPSVKPYQPKGLWEEVSFKGGFSAQFYEQDHGEALYRRSLYTFWKRTVPPPSLQTLDAPEREFCVVRRSTTNTPLQALVLLNDPTFVEASRKLAERLLTQAPDSPYERLDTAFRLALARAPREAERKVLMEILNQQWTRFHKDPEAARKLLSVGESPRDERLDVAKLAAWTTVASAILNLDETLTKS